MRIEVSVCVAMPDALGLLGPRDARARDCYFRVGKVAGMTGGAYYMQQISLMGIKYTQSTH